MLNNINKMADPTGTSGQGIVDDFENSFQACLAALTNPDHFNVRDSEEVKTGVEQTIQRFLDLAKQMECFFLQKRLLLSTQKPEQFVIEDINELKNELARKEQLLQKYNEKISYWQSLVAEVSASPRLSHHPTPSPAQQQQGICQPVPPQHQGASPITHPHQMTSHQLPLQHPPNMHPGMVQQQSMVTHPSQMPQGGQFGDPQQHQGGLQGPLAYLERTTSNIGMPDNRR